MLPSKIKIVKKKSRLNCVSLLLVTSLKPKEWREWEMKIIRYFLISDMYLTFEYTFLEWKKKYFSAMIPRPTKNFFHFLFINVPILPNNVYILFNNFTILPNNVMILFKNVPDTRYNEWSLLFLFGLSRQRVYVPLLSINVHICSIMFLMRYIWDRL